MLANNQQVLDSKGEPEVLLESLNDLSAWEKDMDKVEKEADVYRLKLAQPMDDKRRSIFKKIPKFW